MTELCTVHVSVEGRVQGVGYRMWTEVTARDMGLTGWVRNRRDGSVEMVLSGPRDIVAQMLRACERGPPAAHVTRVHVLAELSETFETFDLRPTV